MHISWEDAQTFLAVAEARSFSAAARLLELGQPTISRRVAQLERKIGRQLFRRGKRGAELTDDGARLLPAAQQMARWAGELGRLASGAAAELAGPVRIAAPPGLAVEFFAPFARLARERLPDIRLEILATIEYLDLTRGGADLAVRSRAPNEPELMVLRHADLELGVFAAPEYVARLQQPCRLQDLDWVTWAFPYQHVAPRPMLERLIPDFRPAFASDDYLVIKAAVEQGLGAMILEKTQHPLVRAHSLEEIDVGVTLPGAQLHLVCAKSMQYVPRVRAVADLIEEQLLSS